MADQTNPFDGIDLNYELELTHALDAREERLKERVDTYAQSDNVSEETTQRAREDLETVREMKAELDEV